jgi:alkylation response protein AidB-like acyl-CoA dehydrogenase
MMTATQDMGQQTTQRPTISELMDRATALRPTIAARADETELQRRVSAQTMKDLDQQGLLSVTKPARFGGYEYGPSALVRLGYELGQVCGSTAWCAALANCNAWFTSYWSLEAQNDVWGENLSNLVAAPLAPTGKCEPVESGYQLRGQWPYASNCENSQWTVIAAIVPEHDGHPAGPAWFLTPIDTVRIDQDSWHMSGLKGTGSKTLVADEPIFVPEHRMVRLSDVVNLTTPGSTTEANPLASFGWSTFGAAALVAPLLGMARGALDWYVEYMAGKMRPGAGVPAGQNPFVQERAGRASAQLDAALNLLVGDLEDAETVVFGGGTLEIGQRVRLRRNFGYAASQAVDVVNTLFVGSGSGAAQLSNPMQRFWRDVNAGAGHVSLDTSGIMMMSGQYQFGLTPTGAF